MNMKSIVLLVMSVLVLQSCATTFDRAESYVVQEQWGKAVMEYRKAYLAKPGDIELKARLAHTELKAADYYYQKGVKQLEENNLDGAMVQFQLGLVAMPGHSKLSQVMGETLAHKQADELYIEALRNQELNKKNDALQLLNQAVTVYPEHVQAAALLKKYRMEDEADDIHKLALESKAPITLNFKNANLKSIYNFIVKSFGINVIFDESVKDVPVTLYAKDVTFDQALNLMLRISKTFYKKIGRNTILVAPDDAAKRGQYEDYVIRTFYLKSVPAKEMASILKSMLTVKKMTVNEELNAVIIRDTGEILQLAEYLIEINDRKPAEMILEVELLEVNRTKAVTLGLDFGSQMTASYDQFVGSFVKGISHGTVTVPNVTFRYFKQDVDAKVLANPKLRAIDNKQAKIHIGDRVPLRSSTVTDATGQTRTTFEYQEIGIRLQLMPDIHLDNSVTINLNLEVSALGPDLGPPGEPTFSIGTRNADSIMLLKDGETAILGGLIRDEERHSQTKVPGLGDIPGIGALFTTFDDSTTRTDVLLTITPRIIRSWDLPSAQAQRVFSGTEKQYSTKPLFAFLNKPADGGYAEIVDGSNQGKGVQLQPGNSYLKSSLPVAKLSATSTIGQGVLSFNKAMYSTTSEEVIRVELIAEDIKNISEMPIELLFNPSMMEFVQAEAGSIGNGQLKVKHDETKGSIHLMLTNVVGMPDSKTVIAYVDLKAKSQGVSYLIYKAQPYTDKAKETQRVSVRASRIVIK